MRWFYKKSVVIKQQKYAQKHLHFYPQQNKKTNLDSKNMLIYKPFCLYLHTGTRLALIIYDAVTPVCHMFMTNSFTSVSSLAKETLQR